MFKEEPAKLIVNRRAIAAGLAALVAAPTAARETLQQLSNTPLTFNATDYAGMMRDGLFLPDYRQPMVRLLFDDGTTTGWHRYPHITGHPPYRKEGSRAYAIETCAPDKNGMPRYTQLAIG